MIESIFVMLYVIASALLLALGFIVWNDFIRHQDLKVKVLGLTVASIVLLSYAMTMAVLVAEVA